MEPCVSNGLSERELLLESLAKIDSVNDKLDVVKETLNEKINQLRSDLNSAFKKLLNKQEEFRKTFDIAQDGNRNKIPVSEIVHAVDTRNEAYHAYSLDCNSLVDTTVGVDSAHADQNTRIQTNTTKKNSPVLPMANVAMAKRKPDQDSTQLGQEDINSINTTSVHHHKQRHIEHLEETDISKVAMPCKTSDPRQRRASIDSAIIHPVGVTQMLPCRKISIDEQTIKDYSPSKQNQNSSENELERPTFDQPETENSMLLRIARQTKSNAPTQKSGSEKVNTARNMPLIKMRAKSFDIIEKPKVEKLVTDINSSNTTAVHHHKQRHIEHLEETDISKVAMPHKTSDPRQRRASVDSVTIHPVGVTQLLPCRKISIDEQTTKDHSPSKQNQNSSENEPERPTFDQPETENSLLLRIAKHTKSNAPTQKSGSEKINTARNMPLIKVRAKSFDIIEKPKVEKMVSDFHGPGEPLMCVWHAVFSTDHAQLKSVDVKTLEGVVKQLSNLPNIIYQEAIFDEFFPGNNPIDYFQFKKYALDRLRRTNMPVDLWIEQIENECWNICKNDYQFEVQCTQTDGIKKLWKVFNRLCTSNTYPPRMYTDEVKLFICNPARNAKDKFKFIDTSTIPQQGFTFRELLHFVERTHQSDSMQYITTIYDWLVKEVVHEGYLSKRTRKHSNWTSWSKRYFILYAGKLEYFENRKSTSPSGRVLIDATTQVERQVPKKGTNKSARRIKINNGPECCVEIQTNDADSTVQWFNKLSECIEANKVGTTPIYKLIKDRNAKILRGARRISIDEIDRKVHIKRFETVFPRKSAKAPGSVVKNTDEACASVADRITKTPSSSDIHDDSHDMLEDVGAVQTHKIKAMFISIDKDGNGVVDENEFTGFMHQLGIDIPDREITLIFDTIDTDKSGSISFEEFYNFFVANVIDGDGTVKGAESNLRKAFVEADRDGSGTISFKEFAEYAYSKRQGIALEKLLDAFEKLDHENKGEVSFHEFRKYFVSTNRQTMKSLVQRDRSGTKKQEPTADVEESLKTFYDDADATYVAKYLGERWKKFASFKRFGAKGGLVMKGESGMVGDIVPGHYTLLDIACFNDLPPIEPKKVVIPGVHWNKSSIPDRSGKLIFPENFDRKIPIEIATNEHLSYYGCSLANGNQLKVSLLYRHGIQDFTYHNNYLEDFVENENAMGGAGLEKHEFAHLDCPLENDSGYFIIGKLNADELHLTAFQVPALHAIYISPNVIHSNDYLKGTWRTMLSDEADVEHVQLVHMRRKGNIEEYLHFSFLFV